MFKSSRTNVPIIYFRFASGWIRTLVVDAELAAEGKPSWIVSILVHACWVYAFGAQTKESVLAGSGSNKRGGWAIWGRARRCVFLVRAVSLRLS